MPAFRHSFLKMISANYNPGTHDSHGGRASDFKDYQYDLLAEHFRNHMNMDSVFAILGYDKKEMCNVSL
jgi:cobyric acid synthase